MRTVSKQHAVTPHVLFLYHMLISLVSYFLYSVLDTGIKTSHNEFGGRASCPVSFISGEQCADGHGHGTHCGGTVGGTNVGVAKDSQIIGVKVLSDTGSGSLDGIISGINWAKQEFLSNGRPAVISMSLGTDSVVSSMNDAIQSAVASGIPVVVAAGMCPEVLFAMPTIFVGLLWGLTHIVCLKLICTQVILT